MAIQLIITNAGRAALVAAANDGTNAVRIASIGVSPTAIAATPATAALPGEIKRIGTLSGAAVADDTIHVTVRDETADVYTVRSIALYLQDGTLFAAYGQAAVIVEKSASALMLLAIDVQLADVDAETITFGDTDFLLPPATTETAGVVELATEAEASAGVDAQRAVTPKGLSFALTARLAAWGGDVWRASNDGAGSGLDADLLDGHQAAAFALLSGAAFSGAVSAPRLTGTASEAVRAAHASPYYSFYDGAQSVRFGYIQHTGAGGDLAIVNDRPGRIQLSSGGTTVYVQNAGLLVGANEVWHAGNLNPANYAPLSGATFTGAVTSGNGFFVETYHRVRNETPDTPAHTFDAGDYFRYVRSNNNFDWIIGDTIRLSLSASSLNSTVPITQNGQQVWHAGNLTPSIYATRANPSFTGEGSFGSTAQAGGYPITLYTASDTRLGLYVGSTLTGLLQATPGNVGLHAIGAGTLNLSTNGISRLSISSAGVVNVPGTLQQGGNAVWHAGNFTPGNYALLSGATFTGPVSISTGSAEKLRIIGANANIGGYSDANTREGFLQFLPGNVRLVSDNGTVTLTAQGTAALVASATGVAITGTLSATGAITQNGQQVWHAGNFDPVAKANLASPALTGTPTAPTAAAGTNTAQIATTAFVTAGLATKAAAVHTHAIADVVGLQASLDTRAPLASPNFTGTPTRAGNRIWDAGNDGAGSGLDADLLDGRHGADFALLEDFANNLTGFGYQRLPGGLILQWCSGSGGAPGFESTQSVAFPLAFPNAALHVQVCTRLGSASTAGDSFWQIVGNPSATAVTVLRQITGSPSDSAFSYPLILAIGY